MKLVNFACEMSNNSERNIQALISMVDEPDPDVYNEISSRIVSLGRHAMPFLENAYYDTVDYEIRERLDSLLKSIRYDQFSNILIDWASYKNNDLLEAWMQVTEYFYPAFNKENIHEQLAQIRNDIWLEMNENLTALEQIKVFNHVFYGSHQFKGNIDDYHNPENSFINKVLEKRTGNPLSLGLVYMIIAQKVDLPVRGINLPDHFVLAYMGERFDTVSMKIHNDKPLFYINAFSNGSIFSSKGINTFLQQLGMEPLPSFFEPCSHNEIILRMLNNIMVSFDHAGQVEKIAGIREIRDQIENIE